MMPVFSDYLCTRTQRIHKASSELTFSLIIDECTVPCVIYSSIQDLHLAGVLATCCLRNHPGLSLYHYKLIQKTDCLSHMLI